MSALPAYVSDHIALFDAWTPADDPSSAVHTSFAAQLERIQQGDPAAFDELVLALARPLEAYARRFTGSADVAMDLVQDVFARLWTHRETLRIRGSVRSYLYTAVRNRALDLRKHARAEAMRIEAASEPDGPAGMGVAAEDADASVYRQEIVRRVTQAIGTLPPRAREVALLRWRDGLGRAEIAAVMGIAVPTVNNQLTLAARVVRTLLADLRDTLT